MAKRATPPRRRTPPAPQMRAQGKGDNPDVPQYLARPGGKSVRVYPDLRKGLEKWEAFQQAVTPNKVFANPRERKITQQGIENAAQKQWEQERKRWIAPLIQGTSKGQAIRRAASHSGPPTAQEIARARSSSLPTLERMTPQARWQQGVRDANEGRLLHPDHVPKRLPGGAKLREYKDTGAYYSDGTHLTQVQLRRMAGMPATKRRVPD